MSRWRFGLAVAIALITGIAFGATMLNDDAPRPGLSAAEDDAAADYDFVIPVGTGERIDAGERIDILPAKLQVSVGESIRITNDDSRGHVVGVFYVGAGETLTQSFTAPGVLTGECTVHSSGVFTLTVVEPNSS
jgi:plastocyanin